MSEGKYGNGDRFFLREYNNDREIEISSYIPSTLVWRYTNDNIPIFLNDVSEWEEVKNNKKIR